MGIQYEKKDINRIGDIGCAHLAKITWNNLILMDLGTNFLNEEATK
jgi:hypothetical protein